jgi:competence protein ComEC
VDGLEYGHPRKATVDLAASLTQRRRAIEKPVATSIETFESYRLTRALYATGWDGEAVVVATNDGTYKVQTER